MKYLFAFLCLIFLATPSMASINVTQADSAKVMKLTPKMERKIQKLKKRGRIDIKLPFWFIAWLLSIPSFFVTGVLMMIFSSGTAFLIGSILLGLSLLSIILMFTLNF